MQVKTERNSKLIQNKKIVPCNVAQLQLALISFFEVKILSFTIVRKVIKLSRILVFRVIPDSL
jgi:hypothetical protein